MSNSFVRLLGLMLIGAMLAACGEGSGKGGSGDDGTGSEGGGVTSVSITADNKINKTPTVRTVAESLPLYERSDLKNKTTLSKD